MAKFLSTLEQKHLSSSMDIVDFRTMHKSHPQVLYPVFRLQYSLIDHVMGREWWSSKMLQLELQKQEADKMKKEAEEMGMTKNEEIEAKLKLEREVKFRMGVTYYLRPWRRAKVRNQIKRIAAIQASLEAEDLANFDTE
jgi:hypothetical protein